MSRKALALSPGHRRNRRRRAKGADRVEAIEERQLSLCFESAAPATPVTAVNDLATPKLGRARRKSPEPVGGAPEEARPPNREDGAAPPAPATAEPEADAGGDVLLRLPAVKAKTGLGRSTIYADMKKGVFPQPRRISARCVAWSSTAIQQWIDARPNTKA
ncbi:helix-turn-helix transcriptional regulator [Nevskia soli]|uniref:helix-turn-helix transcriptional regulator n=1 Tax=Nevskia soli TaxID=418856 RepID=UPI000561C49E|nr:AlpA family phage regulatory protein [Nevskia soli]